MGDTDPRQLREAAVTREKAIHVSAQQWRMAKFFQTNPNADPRTRFPDVRWIKLSGSGLWVSYGELNALADYLPDPSTVDTQPQSLVLPVLQRMRAQISGTLHPFVRLDMEGAAEAGAYEFLPDAVAEAKAMDRATASLEGNRAMGLVARNACHFAPFSWERWVHFHNTAIEHARAYHARKGETVAIRNLDTTADADLRQAWLNNGYGDHFLQDSFAAGHLINKTLVMQWFVDYLNGMASRWWDLLGPVVWWGLDNTQPWYGMPSKDVMETMGTAQQPDVAGRNLYSGVRGATTASQDRVLGASVTNPQTAQERFTREQRVAGSGVRAAAGRSKEQAYRAYLQFLNSSFLQLAAGETHNYFNERGLSVSNQRGDVMQVGGDDTLLTKSGPLGAQLAAEASQMSRDSVQHIAHEGDETHSLDDILQLVPTSIWHHTEAAGWTLHPLEQWQDNVLHKVCVDEIFPDVVDSASSKLARGAQSELVEGGVELDPKMPKPVLPPLDQLGDFPAHKGNEYAV